jgi:N-acetylmuramoyl-L-alanine amidase
MFSTPRMIRSAMRLFLLTTLAVLAANAFAPHVARAQDTARVVYDDGRPEEAVLVWKADEESEMPYIRAADIARIFKATQFWNSSNRKIVLGIGGTRFTFTVDTRVVVVDGEPLMLKTPVLYDAGHVLIPMEFVIDVVPPYTANVLAWDARKGTLSIERVGYNVSKLDFTITADRSTATIELDEPLAHHADTGTPGVIRLKIYGGRLDEKAFTVKEPRGLFGGVRVEQTGRDVFLYFDVKRYAERVRVESEESPARIHVVLEKGDLPEIPEPDFAGRRTGEFIDWRAAEPRSLEIGTVVIDPGHGGKDYGKVGVTGALEKDVNLEIAKKVRDRLIEELGVKAALTREDDRLLSLTQRTEIANEMDGDLFISIHCNGWFSEETGGFEAYFLSPAKTEYDRAVAAAENAADEIAEPERERNDDIDFILWDIVQNEFINESSFFAEFIQKEMTDRLGIRNRGVKQAGFTVLKGARMPAVLVETAFLSNPEEEQLLLSESFQDQVAEGIVEAVREFREKFKVK